MLHVHWGNRHLLGVRWEGGVYVDLCLPFGLWSALKIFTAFADVPTWILLYHGISCLMHYLDDFLIFASPLTDEGCLFHDTALRVLADL